MELKNIRKKQGLKQIDVAAGTGITFQTYSSYETGKSKPTPDMLCRLADFFGVTVDELLGRTTAPQLFDNARIERPEILEIYDELTPEQQNNLLIFARGMAVSNTLANNTQKKRA